MRRPRGLWRNGLTVVAVVVAVGAADVVARPSHVDALGGRGQEAPSSSIVRDRAAPERADAPSWTPVDPIELAPRVSSAVPTRSARPSAPHVTLERGVRFVWPDLDAPYYADPAAAAERVALKAWPQTAAMPEPGPLRGTVAERYLAADVTYLRTLLGKDEPLAALAAYERAVRGAPDFPDAPRALVMLGIAAERLRLAPEADTAFARVLDEHAGSPYVGLALVGRARALRARNRLDEASALLATHADLVSADVRCDVLAERGALARAGGAWERALALADELGRDCPALATSAAERNARADTLLALGRRAEARTLLATTKGGGDPDAEARLCLRAADLAREDGDLDGARAAVDRALGLRVSAATRVVAQARLGRIDARVGPERALATLAALAVSAPNADARGEVASITAETLGDAGRFREALAGLATAGIDARTAERLRDAVLARWIAGLADADDVAGIVTVYAIHRTPLDAGASPATALRIADALRRVGLASAALRALRLRDAADDPRLTLALADAALGADEPAFAREMLERFDAATRDGALASERDRVAAWLAAVEEQLDAPALASGGAGDPAVARATSAAWTARGDRAAARAAWDEAADAYARAAALAGDPLARVRTTASLVEARAAATGTVEGPVAALAGHGEPVVDRAAALLAATRVVSAATATSGATRGR